MSAIVLFAYYYCKVIRQQLLEHVPVRSRLEHVLFSHWLSKSGNDLECQVTTSLTTDLHFARPKIRGSTKAET